jgi:hypothetical protein
MDIILFEDTYPVLFREGPFVVLPAQGVRGIIEVKSTSSREIIQEGIIKGSKNGQIIMSDRVDIDFDLFNGLFCFDSHSENLETLFEPVHNQLKEFAKANISPMFRKDAFIRSCVNCLSFGSDHIIGLVDGDAVGYTFPGLAPAYFISILMKFLQERGNDALRGYLQAIPTKALRGNIFD